MQKLRALLSDSSISVQQLAEKTGIHNNRLQEIVKGNDPTVTELKRIAQVFGIKLHDFLEESQLHKSINLRFRKNLIRKDDHTVQQSAFFADKIASTLELIGDRTEPQTWAKDFSAGNYAYNDAENAASKFRALFFENDQLSPFLSLPKICIDRLQILLFVIQQRHLEGASTVLGGYPFVFVAARTFLPRMLFTLAHEVGHLLAHQCQENFSVIDLEADVEVWAEQKKEEYFADSFASCLLMPSEGIGVTLKKIREFIKVGDKSSLGDVEILYLSRIYGVSFLTAAIRCENLGLLPKGGALSFYEVIKKKHTNPEKRAEALNLPPRAIITFPEISESLLNKVSERVRQGYVSIGKASSLLGISILSLFNANKGTVH